MILYIWKCEHMFFELLPVRTYVCMCIYIYIYIYIHTHIHACICMCIYIYIYIHTYIHTCTYTHTDITRSRKYFGSERLYIYIYIYIYYLSLLVLVLSSEAGAAPPGCSRAPCRAPCQGFERKYRTTNYMYIVWQNKKNDIADMGDLRENTGKLECVRQNN